jgi:hypothetical protein
LTCQESPKSVLVPAACHCLCPAPSESCCSGPHLVLPGWVAQLEISVRSCERAWAVALVGQVVLAAGSLSRATWSMLMSRRPVQRARPSLVWVECPGRSRIRVASTRTLSPRGAEWWSVPGPTSEAGRSGPPGGMASCPGRVGRGSHPPFRRVTRCGGLRVVSAPLPGCACGGFGAGGGVWADWWAHWRVAWGGAAPGREQVVASLVGGSCGIRVCGLPPWTQVPKPPRHSAGAAERTCRESSGTRTCCWNCWHRVQPPRRGNHADRAGKLSVAPHATGAAAGSKSQYRAAWLVGRAGLWDWC